MKFGQLIEYNKIHIFLQEFYIKSGRDTSSRSLYFSKNLVWGERKWSAA